MIRIFFIAFVLLGLVSCSSSTDDIDYQSSSWSGGWSAFAIGHDGLLGHGAGATVGEARQFALNFCGDASCMIKDVTDARCHAASETPGGFWYGTANSMSKAENYAMNFCRQAGAPSCSIRYSHCR